MPDTRKNKTTLPIWLKVVIPILCSLALFLFIIFGIHLPEVKNRMMEQKKEQIHDLTYAAIGVLEESYAQYKSGKTTEKEAKARAVNILLNMRFGSENKDYFWITDYVPNMIMHPYRTDLNGKPLNNFADPKGNYLFNVMVHDTAEKGEAYVSYYWQWKDVEENIVPKLSFVKRFEPWEWIVGTGVYLQDVEIEANAQTKKLAMYSLSIFLLIIFLSGFTIIHGIFTNKQLILREQQLQSLNEELEDRVEKRTKELQESITNLKNTQKQLIESEKMASLGGLVAGVAHEINTPIGVSYTSVTFLEEKLHDTFKKYKDGTIKKSDLEKFFEQANESVRNITNNLYRASELIKSFKQVAVDQTSEAKRRINVRNYIDEILLSLKPKFKHTKHNITVLGNSDIFINSYPGALMQIFTNLIINSLIHGFDGVESGEISIEIIPSDLDGKILTFIYKDNGVGMNEEQSAKLFDPFFTTRRDVGGSGLGMHIVYNLVTQKLGGVISVISTKTAGTEFTINIPIERV